MRIIKKELVVEGYTAELVVYLQDNSEEIAPNRKHPIALICPGGGYEFLSEREGEPVALNFLSQGYQAAVLKYSVAPARYPVALKQLALAMRYLHEQAVDFLIDETQIVVMGFSAGGHLAASLGAKWNQPVLKELAYQEWLKPAALILSYPVITSGQFSHQGSFQALLGETWGEQAAELSIEQLVTADFPATFLWHTQSDDVVPVQNSLLLATALTKAQVPFEFHLYHRGRHGLSLGTKESQRSSQPDQILADVQNWPTMARRFLANLFEASN